MRKRSTSWCRGYEPILSEMIADAADDPERVGLVKREVAEDINLAGSVLRVTSF
jgi:hypothetical protein